MEAKKRCPRCDQVLPVGAFGFRDKAHTRIQSYCRPCSNTAWRAWYENDANRTHHLSILARRRKARIARHRALVRRLKQAPCVDCRRRYLPEAMDFDHRSEKEDLISKLVFNVGTERLLNEINKCDIVCANCHRIRTQARIPARNS